MIGFEYTHNGLPVVDVLKQNDVIGWFGSVTRKFLVEYGDGERRWVTANPDLNNIFKLQEAKRRCGPPPAKE